MAVNIHITIIELNALHTKRQNLFQELDAVIHLLMEAKHWGLDRKSGSAGMPRPISYAVFCVKKEKLSWRHRPVGGALDAPVGGDVDKAVGRTAADLSRR